MTEEHKCPVCGMTIDTELYICPNCGYSLSGLPEVDESLLLDDELSSDGLSELLESEISHDILSESYSDDSHQDAPSDEHLLDVDELPDLTDTELDDSLLDEPSVVKSDDVHSEDSLQWGESDDVSSTGSLDGPDDSRPASVMSVDSERQHSPQVPREHDEVPMVWDAPVVAEISPDEIREGDPFREVSAPVVHLDEDEIRDRMRAEKTISESEAAAHAAIEHLFPPGRGVTSSDFIDAAVGTPVRIGARVTVQEVKVPSCPACGAPFTDDGFQYPPYVFESMGRARMEAGLRHLRANEHEKAIESFEKAKVLFEKAGNPKLTEEALRRVDDGYLAMASFHFTKAEEHLRVGEFEWAIVQFRKAREIYMLTADDKMRAKSVEKVRECYSEWGKSLETEGDTLAKSGAVRDALEKYRQAAEKYKTADDTRRLRGLEKKIKRA